MPSFLGFGIEVYVIVLVFAIPFFFIWRWLFRKFINSKLVTFTISIVATLVSAPIAYVTIISLIFFAMLHYPKDDFDKSKWLADRDKRYEMSKNIVESNMLIGKTKVQIRQLLGKEDESVGDHWEYYIGFVPSIGGIDPDVLDIYFKDNKVIKVGQHET